MVTPLVLYEGQDKSFENKGVCKYYSSVAELSLSLYLQVSGQLFTSQSRLATTLYKKPFEDIVGKGENTGNQHFLLFPQCFLSFP